jgi:peptide deformylase
MIIVNHPHPALTLRAEQVTVFDDELRRLVGDMTQLMYTQQGVGLAAPQVDVNKRVLIIDPSGGEVATNLTVMINPCVIWRSPESEVGEEGCLSLPGVTLMVSRPKIVEIEYLDMTGNFLLHTKYMGLSARIVQHEIDHLDGIMMTNRVSQFARRLALKELSNT